MRTRTIEITALLTGILAAPFALGQSVILQWGNAPPEAYEIYWEQGWIEILEPGGYEFKFWAHDGSGTPGTGVINNITVHQDATGDFSILIGYPLDPNDPNSPVDPNQPGALDWNEGDLTYGGGRSTVTGVKVAGTLADPINQKTVVLDQLDGSIDVGGNVWTLVIRNWTSVSPESISIAGDVDFFVSIESDCAGDIYVAGTMTSLFINGDLSGSIDLAGQVVGNISITGDVLDSGDNHVWINWLNDGSFRCGNMELKGGRDRWLKFGPQDGLFFRTYCRSLPVCSGVKRGL